MLGYCFKFDWINYWLIFVHYLCMQKNYVDLVPKTIMHFLVMMTKENLNNELVKQLHRYIHTYIHTCVHTYIYAYIHTSREPLMSELMKETEDIAAKRKAFKEMKELLMKAVDIVNEVTNISYAYTCIHTFSRTYIHTYHDIISPLRFWLLLRCEIFSQMWVANEGFDVFFCT